ncbi:MAG: permease [Proteobacteria bacterium]|nr:permease [Pseudomonadota bacterium]
MYTLLLSLLALVAGPLVHGFVRRRPAMLGAIDGFSLVGVCGLVLLHGLPDAFSHAGWGAAAAAVAGFFGPSWLERRMHRAAHQAHTGALVLALAGLALHSVFDGAAMARSAMLGLAVALHNLPVGLVLWLLLASYRRPVRIAVLASMAAATLVGFIATGALLQGDLPFVGIFEGLVSGSLLHVLVHRTQPSGPESPRGTLAAGAGALAGVLLLVGLHTLVAEHGAAATPDPHGVAQVFLRLAAQSAPALLLAYLGAGLLERFLPAASVSWLGRGRPLQQAIRGVTLGMPLPICSCGVLPLYRGLVRRGAPTAAALAFLVATPEIGVDAALLSFALLGVDLALARIGCAAIVAVAAAWLVSRTLGPDAAPVTLPEVSSAAPATQGERLRAALATGFGEMVDGTAPWILLGLAIAALGAQLIDARWIAALPRGLDVPLLALIGVPSYVCASGATPIVAMLLAKGVSPGAAIAFLLTGPATNVSTFGVLTQLHGRRAAVTFGLSVAGLALGLGWLLNLLPAPRTLATTLASHAGHGALSSLDLIALGALALLYAASLLRQGPRRFLARLTALAAAAPASAAPASAASCCGAAPSPAGGHPLRALPASARLKLRLPAAHAGAAEADHACCQGDSELAPRGNDPHIH